MDEDPEATDPHDVIPSNCHDILALAEKAVERYWNEPTILNLYPMALLTSHVADWYVLRNLGRGKDTKFTAEFAKAYPAWSAIRDVGNGLKHARVEAISADQFFTEDMMWEHRDAWTGEAYGTMFEGRMMPVDRLCFEFIRDFSGDLMTGRVKELLPEIHKQRR